MGQNGSAQIRQHDGYVVHKDLIFMKEPLVCLDEEALSYSPCFHVAGCAVAPNLAVSLVTKNVENLLFSGQLLA